MTSYTKLPLYLSFAAVLDASIGVQELCLSCFHPRFDRFSASKRIQYISPVQFVLNPNPGVNIQAPIPSRLPLKVIVCHCRCLQYGK